MLGVLYREFLGFALPFGIAAAAWTAAVWDFRASVTILIAVVAGVYGAVRGVMIFAAKRDMNREQLAEYEESLRRGQEITAFDLEMKKALETPSAWQLSSTVGGIGIVAAITGLVAFGISALL